MFQMRSEMMDLYLDCLLVVIYDVMFYINKLIRNSETTSVISTTSIRSLQRVDIFSAYLVNDLRWLLFECDILWSDLHFVFEV